MQLTKREAELVKALHIYDAAMQEMSVYVGHTYSRVGEGAFNRAIEVCNNAAKAQKILDKYDPPESPR